MVFKGVMFDIKWFVGGKLNVFENCFDCYFGIVCENKVVIIFEGELGDVCMMMYK